MRRLKLIMSCLLLLLIAAPLYAQETLTPSRALDLYSAPAWDSGLLAAALPADTPLTIEGRDPLGHWLLVRTAEAQRGWVAAAYVPAFTGDLWALPISDEIFTAPPSENTANPITDDPEVQQIMDEIEALPLLLNFDTPEIQAIFEAGQALGNRAEVFTKVGDSNTTNGDFMRPIGMEGDFCTWGAYSYLQQTVDYFSSTIPREGVPNSFDTYSLAAEPGLSSTAALDPFWADPGLCDQDEAPIACEYRIVQPAVSLIMLGLMDARYGDPDTYAANMETVIRTTIDMGVIPVLTMNVVLPTQQTINFDNSIRMNQSLLDLGNKYGIPVINLWAAVQPIPDYGIGPDRTHLAAKTGYFCDFAGAQLELGGAMRNLLTLQGLDLLRRNVLEVK